MTQHRSQYNIPRVLVTQNMMLNAALGCNRSMEILKNEHPLEMTFWHIPYYILGATALELCAKVVLTRRHADGTHARAIETQLKKLGHNLDQIFSNNILGKAFLEAANILEVEKVNDEDSFIYRYDFHSNNRQPVYVYDAESLKYGLMAGSRSNAGFVAYQFDDLLQLCHRVETVSRRHA